VHPGGHGDDYLSKPFRPQELIQQIPVGAMQSNPVTTHFLCANGAARIRFGNGFAIARIHRFNNHLAILDDFVWAISRNRRLFRHAKAPHFADMPELRYEKRARFVHPIKDTLPAKQCLAPKEPGDIRIASTRMGLGRRMINKATLGEYQADTTVRSSAIIRGDGFGWDATRSTFARHWCHRKPVTCLRLAEGKRLEKNVCGNATHHGPRSELSSDNRSTS